MSPPLLARVFSVCALLVLPAGAQEGRGAEAHLLRGAGFFRAGAFERALVEFRVAERLGAGPETLWYLGASLAKLGRTDDALESFLRADAEASDVRDALLEYHLAVTLFEGKLYLRADAVLASLPPRVGPRLQAEVARMREAIASLFASAPGREAIEWYIARGDALLGAGRRFAARAYFEEAALLSRHRRDAQGSDEAQRRLASLREETPTRP